MLTVSLLLLNFMRLQGEGLDCWEPGGWSGHKVTPDQHHSRYPVNTHWQYWDISDVPKHQQPAVCESIRINNWGIGWSIWFDHEVHKCSIYTFIKSWENSKHVIRGIKCPTQAPTFNPSVLPTKLPTIGPTGTPTKQPTLNPVWNPTKNPTQQPTKSPTQYPTVQPTKRPSKFTSLQPTNNPSHYPTFHPTETPKPTKDPTRYPTLQPLNSPTKYPALQPTEIPSYNPTLKPTESSKPTKSPSRYTTLHPTKYPKPEPTESPIRYPTLKPTFSPAQYPTLLPTVYPTRAPTMQPSSRQSRIPTLKPTKIFTLVPTIESSIIPTLSPSSFGSNEVNNKLFWPAIAGVGTFIICACMLIYLRRDRRSKNHKKSNDFQRLQNLSNPLNARVLISQGTERTHSSTGASSHYLSPFTKREVTISEREYLKF